MVSLRSRPWPIRFLTKAHRALANRSHVGYDGAVVEPADQVARPVPGCLENLNPEWFEAHWQSSRNQAGKRYTPALDVPLPIAAYFESALQERPVFERFAALATALEKAYTHFARLVPPEVSTLTAERLASIATEGVSQLKVLAGLRGSAPTALAFWEPAALSAEGRGLIEAPLIALRRKSADERNQGGHSDTEGQLEGLARLNAALRQVKELDTPVMAASNNPFLLLLGGAGTGKTHLLCEMVRQRIERDAPAVLILGQASQKSFTDAPQMLTDIAAPGQSASHFFATIDDYARRRSSRCLIAIDAINEGHRESWARELPRLIATFRQYTGIALVVSCRTPFEKILLPDLSALRLEVVTHYGFPPEQQTDAVETYFKGYGIPLPEVPLLEEEFSNPLFLKLFCEAIHKVTIKAQHAQLRSLASGQRGMTHVLETFVKQKDRAIAARIGTPHGLSWRFLKNDFARALAERHANSIPYADALALADRAQTDTLPPGTFLQELITEDLLAEDVSFSGISTPDVVVRFSYQKFADHLIARHLLAAEFDTSSPTTIGTSLRDPQHLGEYFKDERAMLDQIGIVEALMIEFPTRIKNRGELLDFLNWKALPIRLCEAFVRGLYWREPRSINKSTGRWIVRFLKNEYLREPTLNVLTALAVKPVHPFGAARLDTFLASWPLVKRDLFWAEYLRHSLRDGGGTPERLLIWAEHVGERAPSRDFTAAYIRVFKWLLTSTQRAFRDRVTHALFRLGLAHPDLLFSETLSSLRVNDPYVPERMLAASYGVTMAQWRSPHFVNFQTTVLPVFARGLLRAMFTRGAKHGTTHILSRDYARRTIDLALRVNSRLLSAAEQRLVTPPFRFGGIRRWRESPDRDEGQYRNGDAPLGMDFGNYTLGHLVTDRAPYSTPPEYQRVKRQILWRIYNLGYHLKAFSHIDQEIARSGRGGSPADESGKTDRYGKKYSWIAFYELAGYRQDRGLFDPRNPRISDADIDPSFPDAPGSPHFFEHWIEASEPAKGWIRGGYRPRVADRLIVQSFDGVAGPWVILDGFVNQTTPDKNIFAFFSGLFIRSVDVSTAIRMLSTIEYPGNHAIPREEDEHYTYAGEVPWADTWRPREYAATIESESSKLEVVVPVRGYGWESYHSAENQVGGISFPSKEVGEALNLYVRIPATSMSQGGSTQIAVLPVLSGDPYRNRESLVLLRQDLLDQYLERHKKRLILFVWGERRANYQNIDFGTGQEIEGRFELSEVLHKQGFIYNGGAFRQFC